jgi:transcription-repair coupling factor (superfamily II helicase)
MARTIRRGDFVDLDGLAEHLIQVGYTRNEPVEQPGQFSIRGGLLDVFSPEAPHPVRIELFGDEVESLREFDLATQRSVRTVEHTLLLPLTSLPPLPERVQRVMEHLQVQASDEVPAGDLLPPGWEFLAAEIEQFHHSVFDLQPRALVVVSEPEAVQAELRRWWKRLDERYAAAQEAHGVRMADGALMPCPPAPDKVFFTEADFTERLESRAGLNLRELNIEGVDLAAETLDLRLNPRDLRTMMRAAETGEETILTSEQAEAALRSQVQRHRRVGIASRPAPRFQGAVAHMMEELRHQLEREQRLVFIAGNAGEVERLGDLFTEYNIPFQLGAPRAEGDYLAEKAFWGGDSPRSIIVPGHLFRGFSLPRQQITFYGYSDLFHDEGPYRPQPPTSRRSNLSTFMSDFRDLAIGDYVVHVEHGVGQYVGLKSMDGELLPIRPGQRALEPSGDGMRQQDNREFMVIEYADHAKLYVPLTRMELVQK